jgi:protein-tyrosine phosphatase
MIRVLFVCAGNVCRSPIAQGVFEDVLRREGLEDAVEVDSAGTGGWFADSPPDERAVASAARRGLDIGTQRARRISPRDCYAFDYVLTMDEENYRLVSGLCSGNAVVRPFLDFDPDSPGREVPDPFYGEPAGFDRVVELAERASAGLLADIRSRRAGARG